MARLAPRPRTTKITRFHRGLCFFSLGARGRYLFLPLSEDRSNPHCNPENRCYFPYNSRTTIKFYNNPRTETISNLFRGQSRTSEIFRGLISAYFLTPCEDYVHSFIAPRPPFKTIFAREQAINSLNTRGPKKQLLEGPCSLRTKSIPVTLRGQLLKTKVFRGLNKQLPVVPEDINIDLSYPRTLYSSSIARELSIIPLAPRGPPFMSSWTRELT